MSTTFAEALAPLNPQFEKQRAAIRPVSRVWFELSDKFAFDICIKMSLDWMEETPRFGNGRRSGIRLPSEARKGETFDITDVLGANPAKAVRVDASDGALWAARLDWPDPQFPRTWVSEFFVQHRVGHLARFGAQLTCVIRGECPQFDITRPNVVSQVLQELSAESDGRALTEEVDRTERHEVSELVEFLYEPSRRLPMLVISETELGAPKVIPGPLARKIAGAAHIVHLSTEASWELTRAIGKRMSVFNGAVRLYLPGLTEEDEDPYQHPLWLLPDGPRPIFNKGMAARVLPAAFLAPGSQSDFPRYAYVRDILIKRSITKKPFADPLEQLRDENELLRLEIGVIQEDRDTWRSLAQEEQLKLTTENAEVERLKAEITKLEGKNKFLVFHLSNRAVEPTTVEKKHDARLESFDALESWAEEVLGDQVYIHEAALKDCKKNGHVNMLDKIEKALLVIRDYVIYSRLDGGHESRTFATNKLAELGMEDVPCFVNRDEAKRTAGYSVKYEGETRVLYDHIKFGNVPGNAKQVRIYYFWDNDRKRFVIGKMPSHLKNNLTT
jgi:hypothetical protein